MPKRRLPDLPDTGRQYVENTIRARLHSPGIEKYRATRSRGGRRIVIGIVLAIALGVAMVWLARHM